MNDWIQCHCGRRSHRTDAPHNCEAHMTNTPVRTMRVPDDVWERVPEPKTAYVIAAIREKLEKETKE